MPTDRQYPSDTLVFPLDRKKVSVVYSALKRAIVLGERKPGSALFEQHLAREFGCSQGPVREALMKLQEDGLVVRQGYRGSFVSETSAVEAALMVQLRVRIETEGVRRAARVVTDEEIARLAGLVRRMETSADDGDLFTCSETDRLFHRTILRISGLVALEPILLRCALHMHRFTMYDPRAPRVTRKTAAQHWLILKTLERRDPRAAAIAVREHIESVIALSSPELDQALKAIGGPEGGFDPGLADVGDRGEGLAAADDRPQ